MKKEITNLDLMKSGVHYGYSRTRRHPTVTPYILGSKNGVDIIDLDKTIVQIENAEKFISELTASGKKILFVGVKPESRKVTAEIALSLQQPYVSERWIGGTLTNFPEIKRRINKLIDMKEQKSNGELAKFTKKEQLILNREMERLEKFFGGLITLQKLPDALLVIDSKKEHIAISEAHKMGIPVIAVGSTDCSIKNIEYPIVANDGSLSSITSILGILKSAFNS